MGKTNPEAGHSESSGSDETVQESGRVENSGNTVQEATHDGEHHPLKAWNVPGDSVVLDMDVT